MIQSRINANTKSFTSIEKNSQACNILRWFNPESKQISKTSVPNILFSPTIENVPNPNQDEPTTCNDKVHQLIALYAKWAYEDKKESADGEELVGC